MLYDCCCQSCDKVVEDRPDPNTSYESAGWKPKDNFVKSEPYDAQHSRQLTESDIPQNPQEAPSPVSSDKALFPGSGKSAASVEPLEVEEPVPEELAITLNKVS